jgi:hypothetical protein
MNRESVILLNGDARGGTVVTVMRVTQQVEVGQSDC